MTSPAAASWCVPAAVIFSAFCRGVQYVIVAPTGTTWSCTECATGRVGSEGSPPSTESRSPVIRTVGASVPTHSTAL